MRSIYENSFTVHKDNQWTVAIAVDLQLGPHTQKFLIKYHHFQSYPAKGDIYIKHVHTKEQIADIFTKPLDHELFAVKRYPSLRGSLGLLTWSKYIGKSIKKGQDRNTIWKTVINA